MSAPQDLVLNVRSNSAQAVQDLRRLQGAVEQAKAAISRSNTGGFKGLEAVQQRVRDVQALERELRKSQDVLTRQARLNEQYRKAIQEGANAEIRAARQAAEAKSKAAFQAS